MVAPELVAVQAIKEQLQYVHVLRMKKHDAENRNPAIHILNEVAEARISKLSTAMFGHSNVDDISKDIAFEMDEIIIDSMTTIADAPTLIYDQSKIGGQPTFVGDLHACLTILINRNCNIIAEKTRRGAGNWCIVGPMALTILQSATTSAFARSCDFYTPSNGIIKYCGTLNNTIHVYVHSLWEDDKPVLVGFKGSDLDGPLIFSPYLPLISPGVMIDPYTFEPRCSFLSKYALTTTLESEIYYDSSKDYLGTIGINADTLSFV
jgi:hypothetical protein